MTVYFFRALQRREKLEEAGEKLDNLKFMCMDARLLPEVFEKDEVKRIYLNFSDPWPKARHAKRRLTSREFLARGTKKSLIRQEQWNLKQTTVELFEFSLEEVKEADWNLLAYSFDLHHEEEMVEGKCYDRV